MNRAWEYRRSLIKSISGWMVVDARSRKVIALVDDEWQAKRIAALPELVEAAKRVHDAFNDHPFHDDKGLRLDALVDAICRAEGRE